MNKENHKAELSWKLADYLERAIEPPERLLRMPEACEGELMSEEEIEGYIADSLGTLYLLRDQRSPRVERIEAEFDADLSFLVSIGRLSLDEYAEIMGTEKE